MAFFPGVYPILQLGLLGFWATLQVTESNRIGASLFFHMRMETAPVFWKSVFVWCIKQWTNSRNSVMLRAIYHCQNTLQLI
jgi:hypothetical protein